MMTDIYLVRHGQTAWNREEIFRGRSDVSLDEIGLKQAELAGFYFKEIKIDAVYSSPLSRAWQTAERIAEPHGIRVQPLQGIIDMSFGKWEGHPHEEIKRSDPETYRLWREEPHRAKILGGETLDEVRQRAMAALEDVVRLHPEKTLVLVSHRVVNKVLLCGILDLDNSHFWQIIQDTTAINLIRYQKGRYFLALVNETCHLKPIKEGFKRIDF
ncbi:MAG: histidine phosphatase family protein [Thermodesulfobacteriota bacterium]